MKIDASAFSALNRIFGLTFIVLLYGVGIKGLEGMALAAWTAKATIYVFGAILGVVLLFVLRSIWDRIEVIDDK